MSVADPFGLVGQVLDGQFRVDKLVGEGGFSAVYRGHHQGLNEPIAIKSLKLPAALGTSLVDTFVQRFRDESRILYRLSQGNLHIVRSIAAGTTQAPATAALVPYMVLEWLEGRSVQNDFTVRRTLGEKGRPIEELVKLFDTAADGLAYAHAQGVVHRDLNPGNLFLANTQHGVKMKVLDFGVAKLMHEGALNMGPRQQTVGQIKIFAPAYGAPEQFDDRVGAVGAHSDVYSFALILLEALRDKCVNEGTHIGEFAQSACDPKRRPTPRSLGVDVPDEVEAAFARATTLDPIARWSSAGDFWQGLTIAVKVATERRHETAARETPPLALSGTPAPAQPAQATLATLATTQRRQPEAAAIGKNLALTMPLGAMSPGLARPAPAAPRPRTPTTIGIPPPARSGSSASHPAALAPPRTTERPPGSPRNPALPAMPPMQPLSPLGIIKGSDRAGAATARFPSDHELPAAAGQGGASAEDASVDEGWGATGKAIASPNNPTPVVTAPGDDEIVNLASMDPLDEDHDEATKVHAPTPEVLRTLALHDAANARATAEAMMARAREAAAVTSAGGDPADEAGMLEAAARAASFSPPPPIKPYVDLHADIPEPPESGGTLMMAPIAQRPPPQQQRAPGGLSSTLAMPLPMTPGFAFAPASPHHGTPQDWQASTMAFGSQNVQEAPGMQGIPGAHGTPPQGVPAVKTAAIATRAPSYGQTSAIVSPMTHGGAAPFGAPQQQQAPAQQHPQQHAPQPQQQPFAARPPGEHAFPLPSYAQPAAAPKTLPIVPIAIALAVLALGGAGLGIFALRARHGTTPSPAASSMASEVAPQTSLTPMPVPVPVEPPPVAAPAAIEEADAAPVPTAAPESTAAAAAPTVPTAAPIPPPTAAFTPPPAANPFPGPTSAPSAASAKVTADPNAFSESAARARLGQANGVLAFCKKEGGVTGPGSASVTFGLDGSVSGIAVDAPYTGTKEGDCVASQFRRAKVPPFTGAPQTVRHSFEVPK